MRLVRGGSADAEFDLGIGALLGLLAAPGAFQSFLLLDKYSTFLSYLRGRLHTDWYAASASDKYLFLSLAMAVTGIVTALKWDRLLPDPQDYLNLAPLPIRRRAILLANASALGIAVLVFVVDVNFASMIFFPLFVGAAAQAGAASLAQFVAVHALCVGLSSLFTFFSVFAVLGVLAGVLPNQTFRVCSSWIRGAVMVGFLMLLASAFSASGLRRDAMDWAPPFWFLGLYQSLQGRATPELAVLARRALGGTAVAFVLMLISYALGYRRRFASVLEGTRRSSGTRLVVVTLAILDQFGRCASGFERAGYRFVIRGLLRSEPHRLCLAVSLGLGWLLGFESASFREGPLIAAFLLTFGLRLAFEIPSAVQANWPFRLILDPRECPAGRLARRVMLGFLTPAVLIPSFVWTGARAGMIAAILNTSFVLALSLCLIEIQLAGYRKIPLTCPMSGFRDNLPLLCLLQFLAFELFTRLGAALESWISVEPWRFLLVPACMLAAWRWNQTRLANSRAAGELQAGITFDSLPPAVMVRLFDAE